MEDTRNYIEQAQARAKAIDGKELSPDEMAREFAKSDLNARVDILDNLDRDLARGDALSLDEAARQHRYVSAIRNTHELLRKAGR